MLFKFYKMKTKLKKCAVITIWVLIIFWFARHTSFKAVNNINNSVKEKQIFVILATSIRPRYRFLLPITVIFWQKLGVKAIVVLVKDKNDTDSEMENTLIFLKELNVIIKIIYSNKLSSTSLSQIIRLFGAVLPSVNSFLTENAVLITSDADLAVFNLSNYLPNLEKDKTLHIHNIECCGFVAVPPMRGNNKVQMYSIGTIAATVKTWKSIMGFNQSVLNVDEIEDYIIAEFGKDFFRSNDKYSKIYATSIWFADQSLISYKLDAWTKNTSNSFSFERSPFSRRVDRSAWPSPEQFTKMKIEDYDDCHQPTNPFDNEWETYLPFLEFAFKNDKKLIERITVYKNSFVS